MIGWAGFWILTVKFVKISHKSELRLRFWDFNSKICEKGLDVWLRGPELNSVRGTTCPPHQFLSTDGKRHAVAYSTLPQLHNFLYWNYLANSLGDEKIWTSHGNVVDLKLQLQIQEFINAQNACRMRFTKFEKENTSSGVEYLFYGNDGRNYYRQSSGNVYSS